MLFTNGRSPDYAAWLPAALSALFLGPSLSLANDAPLTLGEAERLALVAEPGTEALAARAASLREQSVAAGELPDPQLLVGLGNFPIESGGFSTEGMTHARLGVRQAIPPGGTRDLATERFVSLAGEQERRAESRRRDVLTAVQSAWLELYYWQRAGGIVADLRPLFTELVATSESLLAAGRASRHDVLSAELELSRLQDRLIEIEQRRGSAGAALGEWIGDPGTRPVAGTLPDWPPLPSLARLRASLAIHPAVRAAEAGIAARDAGLELARAHRKPGWAVDVAYSYRDGRLPGGMPRSDFVSIGVTLDLPVFQRDRQDRQVAAAVAERSAARAERNRLLRVLDSRLGGEYARWDELGRRIALHEQSILPQTGARSDAALDAYGSGTGDFDAVLRARVEHLDARLRLVRLQVDRARSYAELANLGGVTP